MHLNIDPIANRSTTETQKVVSGGSLMSNRLWINMAVFILIVIPISSFSQSGTPYLFTPSGVGIDDSKRLLNQLRVRPWVQINGPHIQINQTIELVDSAGHPLHNIIVEPAPGFPKVTVHTTIDYDPNDVTNPSRAPFNYSGNLQVGSYLSQSTIVDQSFIVIRDPLTLSIQPFVVGDYIYINDTSANPQQTLLPQDGALEVRKIVNKRVGPVSNTIQLDLDRPLHRPHAMNIIAAHCEPINYVSFRNLEFTTDYNPQASFKPKPSGGIHLHMAYRATIIGITSTKWSGGPLVLLDTGGRENIVRDVYATGLALYKAPNWNLWGIALEGQEDSALYNCGAEGFWEGIVIHYSYNTIAFESTIRSCDVGLWVHSDINNNGSIRSGFVGGSVTNAGIGAIVGPSCHECMVNVDISDVFRGIWIFNFATNTSIGGSIRNFSTFGIGFDLINGGVGDGALTSRETYVNATVNAPTGIPQLAFTKGETVSPVPSLSQQLPWMVLCYAFVKSPS